MNSETLNTLDSYTKNKYKYGFVTDIDDEKPKNTEIMKKLAENWKLLSQEERDVKEQCYFFDD